MNTKKMTNSDRKKWGGTFLAIAVVCVVISAILPQTNTLGTKEAVIIVSLINVLQAVTFVITFFGGIYYLITGFTKKA